MRPFAMARCETTVAEFRLFVEETRYVTEAETGKGCYALNDAGTELGASARTVIGVIRDFRRRIITRWSA